jgi:hypothetical protein
MTWKGSSHGSSWSTIPVFTQRDWGRTWKPSVRTVDFWVVVWTWDLQNMKQKSLDRSVQMWCRYLLAGRHQCVSLCNSYLSGRCQIGDIQNRRDVFVSEIPFICDVERFSNSDGALSSGRIFVQFLFRFQSSQFIYKYSSYITTCFDRCLAIIR